MVSIFTMPKAFTGDIKILQENALRSWREECPNCEILLAGDDFGIQEAASEFDCNILPEIAKNEFGSYYLDDLFRKAKNTARFDKLIFLNTDCILVGNLETMIQIVSQKFENFLIIGARYDSNISVPLPEVDWRQFVLKNKGFLHPIYRRRKVQSSSIGGLDFFCFTQQTFKHIPPFVIGVSYWDGWIPHDVKTNQIPMIDISEYIAVVHQKHPERTEKPNYKKELLWNKNLCSGQKSSRDADFIINKEGQLVRDKRLTIFSFSEKFEPATVDNWQSVAPNSELILIGGNLMGVDENLPRVFSFHGECFQGLFGSMNLVGFFKQIRSSSRFNTICCLKSNCFLFGNLEQMILKIKQKFSKFLIIGKAWKMHDNFTPNQEIVSNIENHAQLLPPEKISYLIFGGRAFPFDIETPEFFWDFPYWESWFLNQAKELKTPIIDASQTITAIIADKFLKSKFLEDTFRYMVQEEWNKLLAFSIDYNKLRKNFGGFSNDYKRDKGDIYKKKAGFKPYKASIEDAQYLYSKGELVER